MKLGASIARMLKNETGATAIEYALVAGIMATALIAVAGAGGALTVVWNKIAKISSALKPTP